MVMDLDPVLLRVGALELRWLTLAYLAGFAGALATARRQLAASDVVLGPRQLTLLVAGSVVAVLIGTRAAYVVLYNPWHFVAEPARVLAVWRGGQAFHGGLAAMALWLWWCARKWRIGPAVLCDAVAFSLPPWLMLGRLGNFLNGELYGRPSELPWCVVFPAGGPVCRHPSQLYEALLEGPLLLGLLLWRRARTPSPGQVSAAFLVGYGVVRALAEMTRAPNQPLGLVLGPLTMGQVLSLAMVAVGILVARRSVFTRTP